MTRTAFWRAWSIWAVTAAVTATAVCATVIDPLSPKLAAIGGSGLNGAVAVAVFGVVLAHFPRTLTLANWLGCMYLLGFGLCVFVVLLFPTGHLPSRRWRPVAWAAGAGLAGWVLGCAFAPTIITISPTMRNPLGVTGPAGDLFKLTAFVGTALIAVTGLAAVLSLAFRYRRAQTVERAQLKWLVTTSTGSSPGLWPTRSSPAC